VLMRGFTPRTNVPHCYFTVISVHTRNSCRPKCLSALGVPPWYIVRERSPVINRILRVSERRRYK
jgi:hypothetical protein